MLRAGHHLLKLFRCSEGHYCEKNIRGQFSRKINFPGLFDSAFLSLVHDKPANGVMTNDILNLFIRINILGTKE
ncbi:hypothetical protein DF182_26550 [Chitinophaga flava]|uniref:Uncharacterized protein n=1 Tax=Chitinophaga flava TaxID=2259036 RepID=A0A365XWE9_9BACT|nr:hypothetical protein DF182_26550 [Chitinophaga flava]